MQTRDERIGELMILVPCVLEGLFPILAAMTGKVAPPIFFTGIGAICAALIFVCILLISGRFRQSISWEAFGYSVGVAIFVVLASSLIFIGARITSGINTALLLQSEMFFTFIFTMLVLGERLRMQQFLGMAGVLCGTLLVLFNGTLAFNRGDLFIIAATAFFPIGNTFAKKVLLLLPPDVLLCLRYLLGGIVLLVISALMEDWSFLRTEIPLQFWMLLCMYVVLILVISKMFWYRGLRHLPLGKSVYIISAAPAFSLFFAYVILREVPTAFQIMGFSLTLSGVYFLITRRKFRMPMPDPV